MQSRPIPFSGEALPVVGCGTYVGFDRSPGSQEYQALPGVLAALFSAGGTVIDSSPMYGRAETTTGELLARAGGLHKPLVATKVWTTGKAAGIRQIETSFKHLQVEHVDLLQIHNLVDWRTHLATLRSMRDAGRVRYLGITHYTSSAYQELERILRAEPLDFLQVNYSYEDQEAGSRLLPLAKDLGVAVMVNMPLGGGGLIRGLRKRPLPIWAAEIGCENWSEILLKFVLSHPAVTCTIPGTGSSTHMASNANAGMGDIPPPSFWANKALTI